MEPTEEAATLESIFAAVSIFSDVVTVLTVLAGAIIAYRSFLKSQRLSNFQKSIDVLMHFNTRWEAMVHDFATLPDIENLSNSKVNEQDRKLVKAACRRFWGLQSDQFDAFLLGLIDPLTYSTWNVHLIRAMRDENQKIGGQRIFDAWQQQGRKDTAESVLFVKFVEALKEHSDEEHKEYTDRRFCMVLQKSIFELPQVAKFRESFENRDLNRWDWNLELFNPEPRLEGGVGRSS